MSRAENTKHHNSTPEWLEGLTAARKGAHPETNPYLDGGMQTFQSRLWSDGFEWGRIILDLDGGRT
jgi:hypothetical protein